MVFKTTPSEGKLLSAGTFAMPSGENELYSPTSIAADPGSGDLILLGEDAEENAGHKVVQRVGPTGALEERFSRGNSRPHSRRRSPDSPQRPKQKIG